MSIFKDIDKMTLNLLKTVYSWFFADCLFTLT